jgi:hypothetical protein
VSEDPLHVVFGAGQVGRALSARLAAMGLAARAVSRNRPADAATGASVIYQCLNAPYTDWPQRFPPLQRGVLSAAKRTGGALAY